jgi:DNA-binding XRE family transcriptional regulator
VNTRPESFRSLVLRHRARTDLIQRDLAVRAGVSERSVQDWEAGAKLPTVPRLRALIQALLEADGLGAGHELAEARELWAAGERDARRAHEPFDEVWFAALLAARASPTPAASTSAVRDAPVADRASTRAERAQDWGEAPDTLGFVGRDEELDLLRGWVLEERSRVVALLGFGGIGKTSLAARLGQLVAPKFERVYWRDLRNAPPVSEWLSGARVDARRSYRRGLRRRALERRAAGGQLRWRPYGQALGRCQRSALVDASGTHQRGYRGRAFRR